MASKQTLSGRGRKPVKIKGKTFRHRVASRIRGRRLELQMRAEDAAEGVAKVIGRQVSVQTWYHWEKGTHPFDIDVLSAIAKVLRVPPRELLPE